MNMRTLLVVGALMLPIIVLVVLSQSKPAPAPVQAPVRNQAAAPNLKLSKSLPPLPTKPRQTLADEIDFFKHRVVQLDAMTTDDWNYELGYFNGVPSPHAPKLEVVREWAHGRLAALEKMTEAEFQAQKAPQMSVDPRKRPK